MIPHLFKVGKEVRMTWQSDHMFSLNIDLFRGGNSHAEIALSPFFGLLIPTLSRSLLNVFYIRLALDSSN